MIAGTSVTALRSILEGRAPVEMATEVAELVLRALGVPLGEAHRIANRPIPPLRTATQDRTRLPDYRLRTTGKNFMKAFPVARSPQSVALRIARHDDERPVAASLFQGRELHPFQEST